MKLGYSIKLNENQFKFIKKKYSVIIDDKPVIPINSEIQLLMFYDVPVLFISKQSSINLFLSIKTKYQDMLKHLGDEKHGTTTKER